MNFKKCPKCKALNDPSNYFCIECGAFLKPNSFAKESFNLAETKMMRIKDNLLRMELSKSVTDKNIALFAKTCERLEALLSLLNFGNNPQLKTNIKEFLSLCFNPEFQIAFVGTIKTGKSTLINALLGKNYASMAVTPETAALTKFRLSTPDYVKITFYTEQEWNTLWESRQNADKFMEEYEALEAEKHKNTWINHETVFKQLKTDEVEAELSLWSSSKSAVHYFVKEIEVGLSTLPDYFPPQVVLVDTPGLSDPVAYRSELTKQYISRANAVFVCVDAQKLQMEEIETIADVLSISAHNKEKVHIIATHWDKLNDPVQDWAEQNEWLVRQLTGKGFYESHEMARNNIIPTAAYIHILCRDFETLTPQKIKSLKQFAINFDYDVNSISDRKAMMELSKVKVIYEIIQNKLIGNWHNLFMEDIVSKFKKIIFDVSRISDDTKNEALEFLKSSESSLDELKKTVEIKRKNVEKIKQLSSLLTAVADRVEADTSKKLEEICGNLRLKINPNYHRKAAKKGFLRTLFNNLNKRS